MHRPLEPLIESIGTYQATLHPTCGALENRTARIINESRRIGDQFYYDGCLVAQVTYGDLELHNQLFPKVVLFEKKPNNNIPENLKLYVGSHNGFTIFNGHWYALKPDIYNHKWIPVRPLLPSFRPHGILDPYENFYSADYSDFVLPIEASVFSFE